MVTQQSQVENDAMETTESAAGTGPGTDGSAGAAPAGAAPSVGEVVDQIQQTAGQAIEGARQTGSQVIEGAAQQTASRLSGMKDQAADTLGTVAQAVRQTGQGLQQEHGSIARYATLAADRIDGVAGYLHERPVLALVTDTENFARRQPAVFLGAAFTLGLVAARFMKSSRREAEMAQASAAAEQQAAIPLLPPPADTGATGATGAGATGAGAAGAGTAGAGTTTDMLAPDLGVGTTDTPAQETTTSGPLIADESGALVGEVATSGAPEGETAAADDGMIEGQAIRFEAAL